MKRKTLTMVLEYDENTSRERLMEVLGEALYRPDVVLFDPPEETTGENSWQYDNIDATWSITEKEDNK